MNAHPSPLPPVLQQWHAVVRSRDPQALARLLHDDVVFHSPVVHTPQRGKAITLKYLMGAMQVLNTEAFHYLRELVGEHDAMLEFATELDGIQVNGIDLIRWDDQGLIVDFKVMVRPLKAIHLVHQKMGEMLQKLA
ncbi:nuclear transport factor 2 family protein [Ideonella sp. DXS22W]|uniref:Nuclear transport factor 2 family protein n=1 Tax=Pseudaquabacterium inlustre TaxID=2984192 RepID=A0ABU9CIB3_9BURK